MPNRAAVRARASGPPTASELRAAMGLGIFFALLVAAFFQFPFRPHPIPALAAGLVWGTLAVLICANTALARMGWLVRVLASPAVMAAALLAGWSLLRWPALRVPVEPGGEETVWLAAAGRASVMGYAWMAVSAALGAALGSLRRGEALAVWRAWRWSLVALAVVFAGQAFYQYFIDYGRELRALRAELAHTVRLDPLLAQSLEHALKQRRVGGSLGNGNVFAAWLSVLSVFCIALAHGRNRAGVRAAGLAVWLMLGAAVLLTGSRGGLLTFLVAAMGGLLILYFQGGLPGIRRFRGSGAGAVASGIFATTFAGMLASAAGCALGLMPRLAAAESLFERIGKVETVRERLNYWQIAVDVWLRNWWGGGGPGAFETFYAGLKPPTARESRYAHSWIFQTLADLGVVGFALYLALWGFLAWALFRIWLELFQRRGGAATAAKNEHAATERGDSRTTGETGGGEEAATGPVAPGHEHLPPGRARAEEASWLLLAALVLGFNGLFEYSLQMPEFRLLLGFFAGGGVALTSAAIWAGSPHRRQSKSNAGSAGGLPALRPLPIEKYAAGLTAGMALVALGAIVWFFPRQQLGEAYEWAARLAMSEGRPEEAVAIFQKGQRRLPRDERFVIGEAAALRQIPGQREEALERLRQAERMAPLSARVRQMQADVLVETGREVEALAKLDEAVELYPSDAGYRMARAELLLELGRTDAARADLVYVEEQGLLIWEYQQESLLELREAAGVASEQE